MTVPAAEQQQPISRARVLAGAAVGTASLLAFAATILFVAGPIPRAVGIFASLLVGLAGRRLGPRMSQLSRDAGDVDEHERAQVRRRVLLWGAVMATGFLGAVGIGIATGDPQHPGVIAGVLVLAVGYFTSMVGVPRQQPPFYPSGGHRSDFS